MRILKPTDYNQEIVGNFKKIPSSGNSIISEFYITNSKFNPIPGDWFRAVHPDYDYTLACSHWYIQQVKIIGYRDIFPVFRVVAWFDEIPF